MDPPEQLTNNVQCTGAQECLAKAVANCKEKKCRSFALRNMGGGGKFDIFQAFSVGVGNAAPNADWVVYGVPLDCDECAAATGGGGGGYGPSAPLTGRGVLPAPYSCLTKAHINRGADSPVYCVHSEPLGWFAVIGLAAIGGTYFVLGTLLTARKSGASPGLKTLPHRAFWVGLPGLLKDGVAFAKNPKPRSRVKYETIVKEAKPAKRKRVKCAFARGDKVDYLSVSKGTWTPTEVTRLRLDSKGLCDGTVDLECKKNADLKQVRKRKKEEKRGGNKPSATEQKLARLKAKNDEKKRALKAAAKHSAAQPAPPPTKKPSSSKPSKSSSKNQDDQAAGDGGRWLRVAADEDILGADGRKTRK